MNTLFETMLVRAGRVILAEQHLARMTRSAAALGMPLPDADEFHRTIAAAATHDAIRCTYDGATLAAKPRPIPPRTLLRRERARAITLDPSLARTLPEHKLVEHYAVCERALQQAFDSDADEALFLTYTGRVLEGTTTNVFAVNAKSLVTAPEHVLPGITREWVLEQAAQLGIDVELRAPTLPELRDGAFLTGSLTMLAPLRALNGEECRTPGAIFAVLADRWSTLR
ncbi:MAG TPA: aminotransferase class IV [Thermoanaerobaculia bacterium]|jgi:branched-subunit amino acid aminotransferase/4-amino-4-deoxychorismate lyase